MRTSKWMSVSIYMLAVVVMSAGVAFAGPGKGPAAKATGSGSWTNSSGQDFYAEFAAHESHSGRPAKGHLLQERVDGVYGGFEVTVDNVTVSGEYACFGGFTTAAWGTYANRLNQYRWTMVKDGGEGGTARDYLRGEWVKAQPGFCSSGNQGGNQAWSAGNVQIHPNAS